MHYLKIMWAVNGAYPPQEMGRGANLTVLRSSLGTERTNDIAISKVRSDYL